ncbi:hypothetical protein D9M69_471200 [compost metagenome]
MQVIPVLAIGADGEHGHATDLQRCRLGLGAARVARHRRVIIPAQHQARGGVQGTHGPRHGGQVARIHRHHHRPADRLAAAGRRGVTLGQADYRCSSGIAQHVEASALAAVLRKQLGARAADQLQGVDLPGLIAQRNHQLAAPQHQHRQVRRARLRQVPQVGLRIGAGP